MILRRLRLPDPHLVFGLGVAVALTSALLLGVDPAVLAQTPAGGVSAAAAGAAPATATPADLIRQHDRELDAARAQQRKSANSQVKLRLEIETLGEDRRALAEQLIASAARVRGVEARINATQARLDGLDDQAAVFQKSLDERRNVIIEILAALQRMGRQPPPALLVRPRDALAALHTAIMLGAVVPDMRRETAAIAGDLADLSRVRKDIVAAHRKLSQNLDKLAREQLRQNMLIDERQKRQASAEHALETEQQHEASLARRVDNLRDLIAKLERGSGAAPNPSGGTTSAIAGDAARPALSVLDNPGRLTPAVAFVDARGRLQLPVNGVPIREFGQPNGAGETEKGLSIAASRGAIVTSPCDGWVVYAGPFRSYGQLLILNAGGGYHILLAGMQRISVDLGQFVLTGEPVAVMGEGAQLPAAIVTGSKKPVLYVEFRRHGTPIDPSPWWATNESEKVRG